MFTHVIVDRTDSIKLRILTSLCFSCVVENSFKHNHKSKMTFIVVFDRRVWCGLVFVVVIAFFVLFLIVFLLLLVNCVCVCVCVLSLIHI